MSTLITPNNDVTTALNDVTDAFAVEEEEDDVVSSNSNSNSDNNSDDDNTSSLTSDTQETSVWNVDGELVEYPDLHFR